MNDIPRTGRTTREMSGVVVTNPDNDRPTVVPIAGTPAQALRTAERIREGLRAGIFRANVAGFTGCRIEHPEAKFHGAFPVADLGRLHDRLSKAPDVIDDVKIGAESPALAGLITRVIAHEDVSGTTAVFRVDGEPEEALERFNTFTSRVAAGAVDAETARAIGPLLDGQGAPREWKPIMTIDGGAELEDILHVAGPGGDPDLRLDDARVDALERRAHVEKIMGRINPEEVVTEDDLHAAGRRGIACDAADVVMSRLDADVDQALVDLATRANAGGISARIGYLIEEDIAAETIVAHLAGDAGAGLERDLAWDAVQARSIDVQRVDLRDVDEVIALAGSPEAASERLTALVDTVAADERANAAEVGGIGMQISVLLLNGYDEQYIVRTACNGVPEPELEGPR